MIWYWQRCHCALSFQAVEILSLSCGFSLGTVPFDVGLGAKWRPFRQFQYIVLKMLLGHVYRQPLS